MSSSRVTRSGRDFSPYSSGPLITAPPNFDVAQRVATYAEHDEEQVASDHELYDSDDEEDSPLVAPSIHSNASPATADSLPPPTSKSKAKNRRSMLKKREQRLGERIAARALDPNLPKACIDRRRQQTLEQAIEVKIAYGTHFTDFLTDPIWLTKRDVEVAPPTLPKEYSLLELREEFAMTEIDWDGITARPIRDRKGVICGLLGARPRDLQWDNVQAAASSAFEAARPLLTVPPKYASHRRGDFPALAAGISLGGGQTRPSVLRQTAVNAPVIARLLQEDSLQRISTFTDCMFRGYAPRLHRYYGDTIDAILQDDLTLVRPFAKSVFAACTFNFGPRTITYPHRDYGNLTWGWCAITALGNYNPDLGGHLVLWDLNCIVRFPPGSMVLIPSALIHHSNTSILPGETRYSFAQYSAGALFRWVDSGFQSEGDWAVRATAEDIERRREAKKVRWARGLEMLSTVEELSKSSMHS